MDKPVLGKGVAIAAIWLGSIGICAFSPENAMAIDVFALVGTSIVAFNF